MNKLKEKTKNLYNKIKEYFKGPYGIYIIAGICVILLILIIILLVTDDNGNINTYSSISVEMNSSLPEKEDYFIDADEYDISKVKVKDGKINLKKLGKYKVKVKVRGEGSAKVIVNVVDTTAPLLELNNMKIPAGETYSVQDFVNACKDNSKKSCSYAYYTLDVDNDGKLIDYSSYKEEGVYQIRIVATDKNGNESEAQVATLFIGEAENTAVECTYGDLVIPETVNYPIALKLGNIIKGCGLNAEVKDNENIQQSLDKIYEKDQKILDSQWELIEKDIFSKGSVTSVKKEYVPVYNSSKNGLIGYAIHVKMYAAEKGYEGTLETDANLKESYYLYSDKTRQYEVNEYNFN